MNVFAGRCDLDVNGEAIDEQCSDSISLCKQGMDCSFVHLPQYDGVLFYFFGNILD